jgi:hypothetical protein
MTRNSYLQSALSWALPGCSCCSHLFVALSQVHESYRWLLQGNVWQCARPSEPPAAAVPPTSRCDACHWPGCDGVDSRVPAPVPPAPLELQHPGQGSQPLWQGPASKWVSCLQPTLCPSPYTVFLHAPCLLLHSGQWVCAVGWHCLILETRTGDLSKVLYRRPVVESGKGHFNLACPFMFRFCP